jgi:hypothetical protein
MNATTQCIRRSITALSAFATVASISPVKAITNGQLDTTSKFPNVGAIVNIRHPTQKTPRIIASGSLIHSRVFLTAGHVAFGINDSIAAGRTILDDWRISFSSNALDPSTWLRVDACIPHPDYNPTMNAGASAGDMHDVGALVLHDPITNIAPVTLAAPGFLDQMKAAGALRDGSYGTKFLAVGYGSTNRFPPPDEIPPDGLRRFVTSPFIALRDSWLYVNQNVALGNGGTGSGDSGGPRFWTQPDGTLLQVTVGSRGDVELVSLDVAYRVDTDDARGFLDAVIATVQ